ncbi:hypothetical protein BDY24DRAFT_278167 [Mrakia frigida]|uniref:uncharacterized protein n=1 Tax=Mrakia frigida TaxID=29902 RepID=UPI003FCC2275
MLVNGSARGPSTLGLGSNYAIFLDEFSPLLQGFTSILATSHPNLKIVREVSLATHVVLDRTDASIHLERYLLSQHSSVKVVSGEWLNQCLKQGKMVSEHGFGLRDVLAEGEGGARDQKDEESSKRVRAQSEHHQHRQDENTNGRRPADGDAGTGSSSGSNKKLKVDGNERVVVNGNGNGNGTTEESVHEHRRSSSAVVVDKIGRSTRQSSTFALPADTKDQVRTSPSPNSPASSTSHSFASSSGQGYRIGERLPGCPHDRPSCHFCGKWEERKWNPNFKDEQGNRVDHTCRECAKFVEEKMTSASDVGGVCGSSLEATTRLLVVEGEGKRARAMQGV